jgi:hypothetical protein
MRVASTLLIGVFLAAAAHAQAPAPKGTAPSSVSETHEGLSVSAAPWTSRTHYKARFPKKNPMDGGALAIDVVLRNDTDQALHVNLERIRLLLLPPEGDRQQLAPLSSEELADLVFHAAPKDPTAARRRLPIPHSDPRNSRDKAWAELQQVADNASLSVEVIPPHASLRGLLYFDMAYQFDLLEDARLYIPEITVVGGDKSILYFELDLSKTGSAGGS